VIAPSHGPVHDMDLNTLLERYDAWSTESLAVKRDLVLIGYCSAYGFTEMLAQGFAEGVRAACPEADIRIFDFVRTKPAELIGLLPRCALLALGSPTINKDTIEPIKEVLNSLGTLRNGEMYGAILGSYGWSGEAIGIVRDRMEHSKIIMPFSPVATRFKP
ncbi:hypothetical protein KIPB_012846, partial [Kipferlia bialata]